MTASSRLRVLQDETFALSNQTLASFRIVFFFFAIAVRPPASLSWATDYPDWLRDPPPGLPSLIGIPPTFVLITIQWGIVGFAVMGLVGYRTRLASVGYPALLLGYNAIEYSFGKIDHTFVALIVPLALSTSGWGDAYGLDARRSARVIPHDQGLRNSRSIALLYAFFAVAYFTAAAAKLPFWTDLSFSSSANWVRYYLVIQPEQPLLADQALGLPRLFWEAIDWATIGIELAPLIFLFVPTAARRVGFALLSFHLGVLLTMGIDFSSYLLVYVPLVAHPEAGARFAQLARRFEARTWLLITVGGYLSWTQALFPAIESLGGEGGWSYVPTLIMFTTTALILIAFSIRPPASEPGDEADDYIIPSSRRATSDIRVTSHGGSNTRLTSTSSTPGRTTTAS